MPAAAGSGASSGTPRAPKKPKAPILPSSNPALSTPTTKFVPTADISKGRVSQSTQTTTPTRSTLQGTRSVTSQPDSDRILFSALANLMRRNDHQFVQNNFAGPTQQANALSYNAVDDLPASNLTSAEGRPVGQYESTTPSYSNYAEMMDRDNAYSAAPTSPVKVWQPQPLTPERTGIDDIKKRITRKLSRRGGQGIVNPASPIQGYEIGDGYDSDFGPRVHPVHGGASNHTGDDISRPQGTPIYAPVGGMVSTATSQGGAYGNQIILDHGAGEQSMYGHLAEIAVQPGIKVKKGDLIGFVGGTPGTQGAGLSTGAHLHYENWKDGQPFDIAQSYAASADEQVINQAVKRRLKNQPLTAPVASVTPPQDEQEGRSGVFGAIGQALAPPTPEDYYESRSFWEVPGSKNDTDSMAAPSRQQAQPMQQAGQLAGNPQLNALMQAIREQESGGNYGVQNGIGARGAYQIMPSNIDGAGGWDMEALGQEITGQEFLASPTLQDKIAKFKLRDYFKQYGPAGAAKAWYAGPGNAGLNSDAPQYGGPSVNDYADNVLRRMQKYMSP